MTYIHFKEPVEKNLRDDGSLKMPDLAADANVLGCMEQGNENSLFYVEDVLSQTFKFIHVMHYFIFFLQVFSIGYFIPRFFVIRHSRYN